jgi:hypothetical protein
MYCGNAKETSNIMGKEGEEQNFAEFKSRLFFSTFKMWICLRSEARNVGERQQLIHSRSPQSLAILNDHFYIGILIEQQLPTPPAGVDNSSLVICHCHDVSQLCSISNSWTQRRCYTCCLALT